ncbi:MAG: 30S ribosomal protein S18 [Candidatus Sericytochromatia bacterium]
MSEENKRPEAEQRSFEPRPAGDRPAGDRPYGDRPRYSGGAAAGGDRPRYGGGGGDRPRYGGGGGGDRRGGGGGGGGFRPRRRKQKVSKFDEWRIEDIDYKDVERLKEFLSEHAKILSRRVTGTRAKHQRRLTRSVKRARYMALLPYVGKIEKTHHPRERNHDRGGYDRGHDRGGYSPDRSPAAIAAATANAAPAEAVEAPSAE